MLKKYGGKKMLTFLTGTHFSAKKNFIYEKICSFLGEGKAVYLIVPEQAGFYLR